MIYQYGEEEIEDALAFQGLESWITVLIEDNAPTELDDESREKYYETAWPHAMKSALQYLMNLQGLNDSWSVEYENNDGVQKFTIQANFRMGEAIL